MRVWDVRQQDAPVAALEPGEGQQVRDAWCVAFGNSFNDEERCLLAGYDNGDVKMFDLRMNRVRAVIFACVYGIRAMYSRVLLVRHHCEEAAVFLEWASSTPKPPT